MPRNPADRHRAYLLIAADGASTNKVVADVLEQAASRLRQVGPVVVQGMTFEHDGTAHQAAVNLTVYFDRVERREAERS